VNEPVSFTNSSVLADGYVWDFGDGSTSTETTPTHAWTLPGTYTVTLTASGGNCTDMATVEITVEMTTGIAAAGTAVNLAVWATKDHLIITHAFGNKPVDVDVLDATGRLVLGHTGIVMPERITLDDHKLSTGVWFVRVKSGDTERTFRVPLVR
jgi:PKD repeat protein